MAFVPFQMVTNFCEKKQQNILHCFEHCVLLLLLLLELSFSFFTIVIRTIATPIPARIAYIRPQEYIPNIEIIHFLCIVNIILYSLKKTNKQKICRHAFREKKWVSDFITRTTTTSFQTISIQIFIIHSFHYIDIINLIINRYKTTANGQKFFDFFSIIITNVIRIIIIFLQVSSLETDNDN